MDGSSPSSIAGDKLEPETQESFTQHEMTQTGNELTQMGLFDDDDCDGNDCNDDDANSRQPMIDPLTLPWGRLMPVGSNGAALPSAGESSTAQILGGGDHNNSAISSSYAAATTSSLRPSTREAIEMLPRSPETRTITRSRSPSVDVTNSGKSSSSNNNNDNGNSQNDDGVTFLGLKNLLPSDRFNEYVMGRSVKVSVCVSFIILFCLTFLSPSNKLLTTHLFLIIFTFHHPTYHRLTLPPKK